MSEFERMGRDVLGTIARFVVSVTFLLVIAFGFTHWRWFATLASIGFIVLGVIAGIGLLVAVVAALWAMIAPIIRWVRGLRR